VNGIAGALPMAPCTSAEAEEAEAQLFPLPSEVEFWLQSAEVLEQCDDHTLTSQAKASLEWLKCALKNMYKSKHIKEAVRDLFNVIDFTHNLGMFGIFDELRCFCQEAADELGLDMQAFFEGAGLAASLGGFRAQTVRDPPILRQDSPAVGVPEPPHHPKRTPIQHENVVLHALILLARALDPGFQDILATLAKRHRGRHRAAPTKGHARMMNKAVSRDDHRFKKPPVVMHNLDMVRCAVTFDEVQDLKAMLMDLEDKFGPPARDKNMFAFDDAEAAAQLHYRTFMRNFIFAPQGLTYGQLARQNAAAWERYLESPPEDPNEPWARFRADAARAVAFLRSGEIASRPVRLVCEVQCLLQKYLDGRLKMHGLYKVIRAPDEKALYSDFKRDCAGYAEGTTWAAVQQRALEAARWQVDGEGRDVNAPTGEAGMTPLLSDADRGHVQAVRWLLGKRADVELATANDGATPLYLATENGHLGVVSALLQAHADPNRARRSDGATPLGPAAAQGDVDVVQLLLEHRAAANVATCDLGLTPLWRAAHGGHTDAVRELLAAFAEANRARAADDCTPLFMAAQSGYADVVAVLLTAAADVHRAKADDGVTPLNMAAFKGHVDVAQALLRRRADVNAATDDGKTPLYVAAENGHLPVVEALLEEEPAVNKATVDDGTPPLYVAAQNGHEGVVRVLLKKGSDVNQATTNDGATPLWVASESGHVEVVLALLEKGADTSRSLTTDQSTPLFMAAYFGHTEIVGLLIDRKADVLQTCGPFGRAKHGARSGGHAEVVTLLERAASTYSLS